MGGVKIQTNRFKNRDEYASEAEDLALDTVPRLSKALQNKNHPLFKDAMYQLQTLASIDAADRIAMVCEKVMDTIIKIATEKTRFEQSLRDAIATEELVEARQRAKEMQTRLAKQEQLAAESGSMKEIIQGVEVASAWMKSETQNIKKVASEITHLNHQIENANTNWTAVQEAAKIAVIKNFIANKPSIDLEVEETEEPSADERRK